jgi:hypothetical protein|tara:strand:- start:1007 stop:1813 length:807 start_codon:yes stop_codon:yes gene_type:complete
MAGRTITPFKSLSPLKGRRKQYRDAATQNLENLQGMKSDFQNMETNNLAAGYKDFTKDLTNKFANQTVDTTTTDRLQDISNQQLGTTLSMMKETGAFNAGNVQSLANAQTQQAGQITSDLSRQVQQNKQLELQGEDALQTQQMQGKMAQQDAIMQGESASRDLKYQKAQGMMAMEAGELEGARAAEQSYRNVFGKIFGSDRKLKQNISLVGKSPTGINIYTFKYINKSFGEGTYQGVMSDEVPNAVVQHPNGYDMVDYSKLDVEFIKI